MNDELTKEARASEIIRTGTVVNIPDPHHANKRIVGWRVDENQAGLSDALLAMGVIKKRAGNIGKTPAGKIAVRIPVIVTADGKWAAHGSHQPSEPDWDWIDETCDYDNPTINPQRMFILAELPVPEIKEIEAINTEVAEPTP